MDADWSSSGVTFIVSDGTVLFGGNQEHTLTRQSEKKLLHVFVEFAHTPHQSRTFSLQLDVGTICVLFWTRPGR